jgi:hypothetical protein
MEAELNKIGNFSSQAPPLPPSRQRIYDGFLPAATAAPAPPPPRHYDLGNNQKVYDRAQNPYELVSDSTAAPAPPPPRHYDLGSNQKVYDRAQNPYELASDSAYGHKDEVPGYALAAAGGPPSEPQYFMASNKNVPRSDSDYDTIPDIKDDDHVYASISEVTGEHYSNPTEHPYAQPMDANSRLRASAMSKNSGYAPDVCATCTRPITSGQVLDHALTFAAYAVVCLFVFCCFCSSVSDCLIENILSR